MSDIRGKIMRGFYDYIYPDHNSRRIVKKKLKALFSILDLPETTGLNVGTGSFKLNPKIQNLDISLGEHVDIVGFAESIPCPDNSFDLLTTQECLEHVQDPFKATNEISRILKTGGKLYLQLPFIIGYHPPRAD